MTKRNIPPVSPDIADNRQFAEERMELLEVIREIVDQEIDAKLNQFMQDKFPDYDKENEPDEYDNK